MSKPLPRLPFEIICDIIDLLYDDRDTLKKCCLLSKSCIPLARRHLFKGIRLNGLSHLKAWAKLFQNPAESPAHHACWLIVSGFDDQVEGAEECGWIQSFTNVTNFSVHGMKNDKLNYLHNFSPVVKSLCVNSNFGSPSNILTLVCSFPCLEDLEVLCVGPNNIDQDGAAFQPSSSPAFTGTLILSGHLEAIATLMLDLPGGLHFKKIDLSILQETKTEEPNIGWMVKLTEMCSGTLEYINIEFGLHVKIHLLKTTIDLSKAKRLKAVTIWLRRRYVPWFAGLLETITSKNKDFKQINIGLPWPMYDKYELEVFGQEYYQCLDNILVHLSKSGTICTRFLSQCGDIESDAGFIKAIFPQISKRPGVELVYD